MEAHGIDSLKLESLDPLSTVTFKAGDRFGAELGAAALSLLALELFWASLLACQLRMLGHLTPKFPSSSMS